MLAEDAAWSMPPLASWFRGLDAITRLPDRGPLSGEWRWRHLADAANGQAAVGRLQLGREEQAYRPFALDVLTLEGERIKEVTAFITRSAEGEPATSRGGPTAADLDGRGVRALRSAQPAGTTAGDSAGDR